MKLEQITAELYAIEPGEFVAARDEYARAARADGNKPLATAISRLRRPTVAAWAVNLLARNTTQELGALLELGAALREAQRTLSADRLRTLTEQRRKAVNALTRTAARLAAEHGKNLTEPVLRTVTQTLNAALADPEIGALVRAGVVTAATDYEGFGPAGPALAAVPGRGAEADSTTDAAPAEPAADDSAARLAAAMEAVESARAARDSARDTLEEHLREVAEIEERIAALRAELDRAEETRRFTTTGADSAERALHKAEEKLDRALRAVEQLRGRTE